MFDQKQIWRVVVPVVLMVLLLGMTVGILFHHHAGSSTDSCPLCHLVIAPSLAGIGDYVLVPIGTGPGQQSIRLIAYTTTPQIPARAPPV
jgi:hypothetical protein